jgi:phosphatidate cytidylyltransferase
VIAALPAIAFAIFIVVEGGIVFALGVLALGVICLHELFQMLDAVRPVRLAGFVGLTGIVFAALYGDQFQMVLVIALLVPLTFLMVAAREHHQGSTLAMATTLLGVLWIGMGIGHAVLLRGLHHGDGVVIDVLVGTFLGDTGAYFAGRMFGMRPLAPRLSPNKTLEGLAGGILIGVLAVWFAGLYQDWMSGAQALLLGVAVAVAAPLGDLFESLVKRDVGTKDTGRLFGAHGGALDRLDAVLFTLVIGYYVWAAMV